MVAVKPQGAAVYDQGLDPRDWVQILGTTYLNYDMEVKALRDIQIPEGETSVFVRPLLAHKSLDGQTMNSWRLSLMKEQAERSKRFPFFDTHPFPGTLMLVARAKKIPYGQARFWRIGGKLLCDKKYSDKVSFTRSDLREIRGVFKKIYRVFGQPILTADFIRWRGRVRMVEMNGPNFAGVFDPKVVSALVKWLSVYGRTVRENLKLAKAERRK